MPRLIGQRVMLREYKSDDLPEIRKWVNVADSTRYLSTNFWPAQTVTDTEGFLQNMMQSSKFAYNFVIADARDERYIGQIDIFRVNWQTRQGELGMVIGQPDDRGCGYGAEALGLLQDFAFLTLGFERLELEVHMDNAPALACYRKAGFTLEGVRRHAYYSDGRFRDVGMMSVLRGDYDAARA